MCRAAWCTDYNKTSYSFVLVRASFSAIRIVPRGWRDSHFALHKVQLNVSQVHLIQRFLRLAISCERVEKREMADTINGIFITNIAHYSSSS